MYLLRIVHLGKHITGIDFLKPRVLASIKEMILEDNIHFYDMEKSEIKKLNITRISRFDFKRFFSKIDLGSIPQLPKGAQIYQSVFNNEPPITYIVFP